MKQMIHFFVLLCAVSLPVFVDDYILSVLILTFYFAYIGQAWNLMMGYAGQLSLGHALYVGLGAYIGAATFVHFEMSPLIAVPFVFLLSAFVGALIAWIGFRFAIKGVHFTLLTIAFAECARIIFEHWHFFGAMAGFFIPVKGGGHQDWLHLRADPIFFYYAFLVMTVVLYAVTRHILKTRFGYFMLALREDQEAAESVGISLLHTKMMAVALSGGLASLGGLVFAFYQNSLFPGQVFSMANSIEFIMGPIVGGVGSTLGPIIGAIMLTPLGEFLAHGVDLIDINIPGVKHLFYGIAMLLTMLFLPKGIWPSIQDAYTRRFSKASGESKDMRHDA